jgi:myo-inositol-1(or 4)-monophosphatase
VVDPLDGTHNYLYGIPLYGVSVAVLEDDVPVASVIHLPEFKETYAATDGGGAFLNGKPIRVSTRKADESMIFFESQLHRKTEEKLRILGGLSAAGFSVRILGVATLAFGWLARGFADFYAIDGAKLCDVAAGALLVSEAGGMVSDFYGEPWNRYSKNVAASNGVVHERLIEKLK